MIRINKYLASHFALTRREADRLIEKKEVRVNGRPARLGEEVTDNDQIEIISSSQRPRRRYFLYHKPAGLATLPSSKNEPAILSGGRFPPTFFPVGRLDKASRGLIIVTNDGRLTAALLDPEKKQEKEYVVTVDKTVTAEIISRLSRGVKIEKYRTKPAQAWQSADKEFHIILMEGKKHQIRRMAAALGLQVKDLWRIRIGRLQLADLPAGQKSEITGDNLKGFLSDLGLA